MKNNNNLPVLVRPLLPSRSKPLYPLPPKPLRPVQVKPIYPKLVAVIPHKVSGCQKPVDSEDLGNNVNTFG